MPAIGGNGLAQVKAGPAPAPQRVVLPNPDHQVYHAPAPVYHAPPQHVVVVPNPDQQVYHAPAPQRLTPVQHAAQSVGAAHAGNAVARDNPPIRAGLGLTPRQAAVETMNQAKLAPLLNTSQNYAPSAPHISAAAHGGGYGAQLAAIRAPGGVGDVFSKLVGGAISLPLHMVEGTAQLGKAFVQGASSGHLLSPDPGVNPFAKAVGGMIHSDPIYQAVDQGSLHPLVDHPLNTALDVLGGYGALGRAAGGLAREANLGGATARADRLLNPGIPGSAVHQTYSPNLFTQALQKHLDAHPLPNGLVPPVVSNLKLAQDMRKQTAMAIGTEKSAFQRTKQDALNTLASAKPKGAAEANTTPLVAGFGVPASGSALDTAAHFHQVWQDQLHRPPGDLVGSNLKNLQANAANAKAAVDKGPTLDSASMVNAAQVFHDLHTPLEQAKNDLNITDLGRSQRRIETQYALERMPGAQHLDGPVIHPDTVAARREAGGAARDALQNLNLAKAVAKANDGFHKGYSSALSKYTRELPLHPATDTHLNNLLDQRTMIDHSAAATSADHKAIISALQDTHKDALNTVADLKAHPQKIDGLVMHDPTARPLTGGTIGGAPAKGLQLRPLTRDEVQAHMAQSPVAPSYINMTNAERPGAVDFRGQERAATSSNLPYSGKAIHQGDSTPGWASLPRTLNKSLNQVGQARMTQNLLDRFGTRTNFAGEPLTQHNIEHAMTEYQNTHGTEMAWVHDPHINAADKGVVMMPKARVNEIQKHFNLAAPGTLGRVNNWVSGKFANTVLPTSPKLMIAHTGEMAVRAPLAGVRAGDGALAKAMLSKMSPEGAARLTDLATPGGMAGHIAQMSNEAKGVVGARIPGRLERTVTAPSRAWDTTAQKIIGLQRATIKPTERAALGVHIRQTARDLGLDPHKDIQQLAAAYENPALQEHAAQFHADKMGRYTNLTAFAHQVNRTSPFAPWYANAAKLVYKEMPLRHPLITSGLTNEAASNQKAWDAQHAGMPSDMQSYLQINPGHFLDTGKFGPLGVDKNPLKTALGLVAPAYQGAAAALTAHDPFWGDFKGPPGTQKYGHNALNVGDPQTLLHALDTFGHSTLGPVGHIVDALQNKGQTLYNTSLPLLGNVQLKPGTSHGPGGVLGGLKRWLNPFYGAYMHGGSVGGGPVFHYNPSGSSSAPAASSGSAGKFVYKP